jgi:hypothetical protein
VYRVVVYEKNTLFDIRLVIRYHTFSVANFFCRRELFPYIGAKELERGIFIASTLISEVECTTSMSFELNITL